MRALLRQAIESGTRIIIPAGVLAQIWRDPARQVPLRALVHGPTTAVSPLDQVLAEAAGVLCARSGTAGVIDASVVLTARRERAVVVTSDVDDLRRLDRTLQLHRI
jgi:hypothetical protein